jgi:hypothetical protein
MPTIAETSKEKRLFSELFNEGDVKTKKQRVRFDDNVEVLTEEDDEEDDDQEEEEEEEEVEFVLSIGEDGDFDYTIITTMPASSAGYKPSQEEDIKKPSSPTNQEHQHQHQTNDKIARPASPFAGSDRRLCEELYMSSSSSSADDGGCDCCCEEEGFHMMTMMTSFYSSSRSSVTWPGSLGNNLKVFIPGSGSSSSDDDDDEATFVAEGGATSPRPHDDGDAALLTPLITPPSSPRRVVCTASSDGVVTEEAVVICEWPCNLTVDNAITSALELPLL